MSRTYVNIEALLKSIFEQLIRDCALPVSYGKQLNGILSNVKKLALAEKLAKKR